MVLAENIALGLGSTTQNRFLDRVEMRDGAWRILRQEGNYAMSGFTVLTTPPEIDEEEVRGHPRGYVALAYLLERSGFPLAGEYPTRGSALEAHIKAACLAWLDQA